MKLLTNRNKNKALTLFLAVFAALMLLGLSACGGGGGGDNGGGSAPLTDQDASGLYKNGTLDLNGSTIMQNDVRGFVHANRIMLFSVGAKLLIDGQIDTITLDDFTATVDIYEAGVKTETGVSVTGKVRTRSKITGTLSGSGAGSGTFSLLYDRLYTRGASYARVDTKDPNSVLPKSFKGAVISSNPGVGTNNFDFPEPNKYDMIFFTSSSDRCKVFGSYSIPDSSINIYMLNEVLSQLDTGCTIPETPNYTGFAAAVDGTSTDDTLLYAVTNGTNSQFAILTR